MGAPVYLTGDVPSATEVNNWFTNITFARKTTTESVTSSTVLQDDDHLFVSIDATTYYEVTCMIRYDGDPAGDLQTAWSMPGGTSWSYVAAGLDVTTTAYSGDQTGAFNQSDTPSFGCITGGVVCGVLIHGLLTTSATAGQLKFRWSQRTASATATRVLPDSYLLLRRVA